MAKQYLEKLIALVSETTKENLLESCQDTVLLLEIAGVYEATQPKKSLQCLLKCVTLLSEDGYRVPPELYNNIGALYSNSRNVTDGKTVDARKESKIEAMANAKKYYDIALVECGDDIQTPSLVTVLYNAASLTDESDPAVSRSIYKRILHAHPAYVDGNNLLFLCNI